MNNCVKPISRIRTGLILQLLMGFFVGISVGVVFALYLAGGGADVLNGVDSPDQLSNIFLNAFSDAGFVAGSAFIFIATLVMSVISFVFYYGGLRSLGKCLDVKGRKAVNYIATAQLLSILVYVVLLVFLSMAGSMSELVLFSALVVTLSIVAVMALVSFILNLVGYFTIKNSDSLDELGKSGAQKLSTAMIFSLVNLVAGIIPFVGGVATIVLTVLYWVFLLSGWGRIKRSFMMQTPAEPQVVPPSSVQE